MAKRPLDGRIALVAGATRGIGKGVAVELAAAGALVHALGRTLEPGKGDAAGSLRETADLVARLGGEAVPIACDCADPAAVAAVVARIRAAHDRLDIAVNSVFSASQLGPWIGKRFWETTPDLWRNVVTVPASSAYLVSVATAPLLMETARRDHRTTLIVNVTGRGAVRYRYNVAYGVGKTATERLTRDCALDLEEHDVAVVSIWPNGHAIDPEKPETPRYSGRAVVALAGDPGVMARSGQHFWSATLGAEYGFTDEHGHRHSPPELVDRFSLDGA
jgi:NAD(P)-dependent dehydrogenase (short-subunit alcohol dehydrogenase family)